MKRATIGFLLVGLFVIFVGCSKDSVSEKNQETVTTEQSVPVLFYGNFAKMYQQSAEEGQRISTMRIKPDGTFVFSEYFVSPDDFEKDPENQSIKHIAVSGIIKKDGVGFLFVPKQQTCPYFFLENKPVTVAFFERNSRLMLRGPEEEMANGAYKEGEINFVFPGQLPSYYRVFNKYNYAKYPGNPGQFLNNTPIDFFQSLSLSREDQSLCSLFEPLTTLSKAAASDSVRSPASVENCKRTCNKGKACGDSCISKKKKCKKPKGSACVG